MCLHLNWKLLDMLGQAFGQLKKQRHASVMVKCVFADAVLCLFRNVGVCGRGPHCPASHLEADLPGPSKQGLWRQVCVRVGTPQMCGAARGLDGDLVRRRGFQPRGRVRRRTETPGVHRGVVKVLPTASLPVAFHRPVLDKTVTVRNSGTVTSTSIINAVDFPVRRRGYEVELCKCGSWQCGDCVSQIMVAREH